MNVRVFVSDQEITSLNFVWWTSTLQKSFFPSAITGWNSLDQDVRNSVSLPTFKAKTRSILFPLIYYRLFDGSLSRRASVDHTPLRLEFSCVREYLFKINSCVSPICECSFDSESVKYFFLYCPSMPLNVMFSLPLLLIFYVKHGHRVAMPGN